MDDIEKRFWKFHNDNPNIYVLLVKFAREARDAGFNNYGIKSIFVRVRWHVTIETRSEEEFKINNSYSSRYARLIMGKEKDLKNFFRIKKLKYFSSTDNRRKAIT